MEPPAKRQRLSQESARVIPSRTIDLYNFERSQVRRRNAGKILLPRVPDVTVTAGVVEVAINDDSSTTQIAAATTDVALTIGTLGTVTIPAVSTDSQSTDTASSPPCSTCSTTLSDTNSATGSEGSLVSGVSSTSNYLNATSFISTKGSTVTVTATSTFHISYAHGSLIPITSTKNSSPTGSSSADDSDSSFDPSSGSSSSFDFNQLNTAVSGDTTATAAGSPYYGNNAGVGATGTSTSDQPGSTGTDSGASPPVLSPQQTRMVGGIVGGIAGIAMVLLALLYLLRWYRERLKKQGRLPKQLTSSHNSRDFGVSSLIACSAPMSQSSTSLFPAPAGNGLKKLRTVSGMTTLTNTTTTTTTNGSERGFHRVSGRKIPSVLCTGGDQFGGSYGAFEKESGAILHSPPAHGSASIYDPEPENIHGYHAPTRRPSSPSGHTTPKFSFEPPNPTGLRSPTTSSPRAFGHDDIQRAFSRSSNKADGVAVYHNSPARTPVMQSPNIGTLRIPSAAPVSMDADVPEMPLPSPGLDPRYGIGVAIGTGVGERRAGSAARLSTRSGRFKENID